MGMSKERIEQMRQLLRANQQALQEQVEPIRRPAHRRQHERAAADKRPPKACWISPSARSPTATWTRLRHEVSRLANRLRSRIALRQKRAKTGQLDAKATIRANLKHGGAPMELQATATAASSPSSW